MTRGRSIAGAAAVLALVLGVAACGQPDVSTGIATATSAVAGDAASSASTRTTSNATDDPRKWAQCMRSQGVPVNDPTPETGKYEIDPGSVDKEKLPPALEACRKYDAGSDLNNRRWTPAELEQWRQWARCMRAHGVDMADPEPDRLPHPVRTDLPLAAFGKAERACRDKVPGR